MKKLIFLTMLIVSCGAFAAEHPALCFKERVETVNGKKSTIGEAVPCPPGKQKTVEQIQREEDSALKRKCGKDYGALRIGMSIKRLEECTGAVLLTQTVDKAGRVDTYRTNFDWVNVQNGKVISYTERTDN